MKDLNSLTFLQVKNMSDEDARTALETIRWPDGPVCPRCNGRNVAAVAGGRSGLYRCLDCRKDKNRSADQFTVTVGSIFEDSHIPLSKWVMAFHVICASKKGVSALQLQRQLGLGSYRSAWHMAHRIRYAMASGPTGPLTGTVEVDESYVGGKPRNKGRAQRGFTGRATRKAPIVAMIERNGRIKAMSPQTLGPGNLPAMVRASIDKRSTLMTDEFNAYQRVGSEFKGGHHTVKHSAGEYARRTSKGLSVHVNTCESWFALFKRGVHGTFHHVGRGHLGRYCDEFEFRWDHRKDTDGERTVAALRQAKGRRLMYRDLAGMMAV